MYLIILHGNKVDDIAILPFVSTLQDGPSVMGSMIGPMARPSAVSRISDVSALSAYSGGRNELSVMSIGNTTTSTSVESRSPSVPSRNV
jgi:hypothetical protein